jgi:hypothetical protein
VRQHERAANFLSLNKLHPLAVTRTVGVFKNACIPFIVERNAPSLCGATLPPCSARTPSDSVTVAGPRLDMANNSHT